jgi:hypothetical protein
MAAYLERTAANLSQPLHDLILWILAERGGKMERNRLRMFTGREYEAVGLALEFSPFEPNFENY